MKRKKKEEVKEKEVVTRTYRVQENVLTLILGVEALLEQQPTLPLEYRKEGYEFLKKIKTFAGIEEKKYLEYDIVNYDYNITFEKNPNLKSDK